MERVRIGVVRYLNTAPLIEGLGRCADVEVVPGVPSELAGMLRRCEVDVALASVVDVADIGDERGGVWLTALPVGMIGCDGPTMTVRVFSSVPMGEVREIAADTDSHTSVILCRLVMKHRFGRDLRLVPLAPRHGEGDAWPTAMLLIGDKVVTDPSPAVRYPYQLDLGEAWKTWTGLPFVYAVWACRRGEEGSTKVQRAAVLLDRQRRHNRTRLDWIVASRAPAACWPVDLASTYLGGLLRYDVTNAARSAAERFVELARGAGLGERAVLRWEG
jgi:chorismate dehydratase